MDQRVQATHVSAAVADAAADAVAFAVVAAAVIAEVLAVTAAAGFAASPVLHVRASPVAAVCDSCSCSSPAVNAVADWTAVAPAVVPVKLM